MKCKRFFAWILTIMMLVMLPLAAPAESSTYYVNTANHKSLNMRAGTSTDEQVITSIPYGAKVTVTGICDNTSWAAVNYGNNNGYVMVRYLSKTKPGSSAPSSETTAADINYKKFKTANYYAIVTPSTPTGHVNLRWEPSKKAQIHASYPQGTVLLVIAETSVWCQVLDESTMTCGFMMKAFLH